MTSSYKAGKYKSNTRKTSNNLAEKFLPDNLSNGSSQQILQNNQMDTPNEQNRQQYFSHMPAGNVHDECDKNIKTLGLAIKEYKEENERLVLQIEILQQEVHHNKSHYNQRITELEVELQQEQNKQFQNEQNPVVTEKNSNLEVKMEQIELQKQQIQELQDEINQVKYIIQQKECIEQELLHKLQLKKQKEDMSESAVKFEEFKQMHYKMMDEFKIRLKRIPVLENEKTQLKALCNQMEQERNYFANNANANNQNITDVSHHIGAETNTLKKENEQLRMQLGELQQSRKTKTNGHISQYSEIKQTYVKQSSKKIFGNSNSSKEMNNNIYNNNNNINHNNNDNNNQEYQHFNSYQPGKQGQVQQRMFQTETPQNFQQGARISANNNPFSRNQSHYQNLQSEMSNILDEESDSYY